MDNSLQPEKKSVWLTTSPIAIALLALMVSASGVYIAYLKYKDDKENRTATVNNKQISNSDSSINKNFQEPPLTGVEKPNAPDIKNKNESGISPPPSSESPEKEPLPLPNLAGEWEASFTHKGRLYHCKLSLSQSGNQVSGTSRTEVVIEGENFYADMRIRDGIISANEIRFKEKKVWWKPLPKSNWCEKEFSLKRGQLPNPETLTGTWIDRACDESEYLENFSGNITLTRKK